jgi:hypothetical protein
LEGIVNQGLGNFDCIALAGVAPQLTVVVMNTISQAGAATHPNGAYVAWRVANAVAVHETTAVPGRSSNDP